jgi:CRISPR system Cascade subunit CasD
MANPYHLILRLEGVLQSWGLRSRWDVRDSGDEPTKSGIIGMLGCSLGYPVGDARLEELDAKLQMGVRTEKPGTPLIDFQTVTGMLPTAEGKYKGKKNAPATILSPRTYLQEAAFLVVLGGPAELLEQCAHALQQPRWPIYFGRKSCPPSRPVFEELTDRYATLEEALRSHPWSCETASDPPQQLRCSVEHAADALPTGGDENNTLTRRCDAMRVNSSRMYNYRSIMLFHVNQPQGN